MEADEAAVSCMRRPLHDGQSPRRLQEKAAAGEPLALAPLLNSSCCLLSGLFERLAGLPLSRALLHLLLTMAPVSRALALLAAALADLLRACAYAGAPQRIERIESEFRSKPPIG